MIKIVSILIAGVLIAVSILATVLALCGTLVVIVSGFKWVARSLGGKRAADTYVRTR